MYYLVKLRETQVTFLVDYYAMSFWTKPDNADSLFTGSLQYFFRNSVAPDCASCLVVLSYTVSVSSFVTSRARVKRVSLLDRSIMKLSPSCFMTSVAIMVRRTA